MSSTEIFRPEAVSFRQKRLYGNITVVNEPVANYIVIALCLAAALAISCAALGQYTRTEAATGIITTSKPLAKILAPKLGIVDEVSVKEGQHVNTGDKLIVVSVDTSLGNDESYSEDSLRSLERQTSINADQLGVIRTNSSVERRRLAGELTYSIDEHSQIISQIDLQQQLAKSLEKTISKWESLATQGYVSEYALEEKRQQLLAQRQNLSKLMQQQSSLKSQMSNLKAQLTVLGSNERKQVNENQIQNESLRQSSSAAKAAGHYVITAPISGTISSLMVASGKSLRSQGMVLNIIPDNTAFEAELYAPTKAIGFIEQGQSVRLLYDAFPYQKFGSYAGTVEGVSRSAISPNDIDVPLNLQESVYRVRVKLNQEYISAYGKNFPLQAGMVLKANIVLERRSFLDWLLEPIRTVRDRG
ncbi:HlyD family efflux transporter periplasmic adaptor subunit [Janthinobacterium sp.]|uniref:HlyD family efflux transporter periplasmic adaptor subunit n=1 Tax=Janthinobacterium sp. TaxID=1871054 RepID=UPI0025829281|nr:HlyD family efflux transporter periplasmic adaptor subunit [Janthinobacterium sp.]MCX7291911.1 HlyD family efflux transporter periplasmic adaptor subunit [Janthinobacterium sp.]